MSTTPTISPQKRGRHKKLQPNNQPRRSINVNDEEETKPAEPMAPAPRASRQSSDHSNHIIKNNKNANTACNWFREDNEWFYKYLVHITSNDSEVNKIISRKGKVNKKAELIKWVHDNIGVVPATNDSTFTKQNIVDIAIVAAGLTNRNREDQASAVIASNVGDPQTSHAINDENARTSCKMYLDDPTRFRKYNGYIRREDPELAKSISRHAKDNKADLIKWVEDNVGFVPDTDDRAFTKTKIVDVAIVASGITRHGAEDMRLKFDAGKMDDIPNTVFHTYNLRSISSQRKVRMEASPDDRIDKHVAHYVGLDVGLTLNNALPPDQRVDSGKLRNALNIRKNMDLAFRDENLELHKNVDSRLLNFDDHGTLSDEEYERLEQIVKHARSHEFQQAMINVNNGRYVYLAVRDRISSFDTGNRQRLWNARTDPSKLKRPSTKSKSSRSPE